MHRERLFMAANQSGKTLGGGSEFSYHLRGEYPSWWVGRRFDKPVRVWSAGLTNQQTRDNAQRILFGPKGEIGTGTVPLSSIEDIAWSRVISDFIDTATIRHKHGLSHMAFKAYRQGKQTTADASPWGGETLDMIWFDEEPPDKVYSAVNAVEGYVPHSAVGYLPGWLGRLFSNARLPNGRYTPYAAASIHGWIPYNGKVLQHYPFTASCWGSGSAYPNTHFPAFENEGGAPGNESEALTDFQLYTNERIVWELADHYGWVPKRPRGPSDVSASLYEHRECVRWGSTYTACPSGRMTKLWVKVEEDMKKIAELEQRVSDMEAGFEFYGKMIVGNIEAIKVHSEIVVNHEKRIKQLERWKQGR